MVDENILETEDSTLSLKSDAPDEFLSKPNTEAVLKKADSEIEDRNVCVVLSEVDNDAKLVMSLLSQLSRMCPRNQVKTETHTVALLVLFQVSNKLDRLGFCDELTASNLVYRICTLSDVNTTVYREFGQPNQRKITAEDLDKRPFRF